MFRKKDVHLCNIIPLIFFNLRLFFIEQYNTITEHIIYCVVSVIKMEQILKVCREFLNWFTLKKSENKLKKKVTE
jgi:hypothetical protein